MNPSPAAIAAIQQKAPTLSGGWAGNTDAQVAATLNTPSIANPTPQPTVPKPFKPADLIGALSSASQGNLKSMAGLGSLLDDIHNQVIERCQTWAGFLAASAVITSAERTALLGVINATYLDPSWPAQISWAQSVIGRPVDADDIAASRP